MTYQGILLITEGEVYRVYNGQIRLSMGALDSVMNEFADVGDRIGGASYKLNMPIFRTRHLEWGKVLVGNGKIHTGIGHPERA